MRDYATPEFFVLRTPNLPFEEFLKLSESLRLPFALQGQGDLDEALAHDRNTIRVRLQRLIQRLEIKEALWLASPEFYESLSIWQGDPESEKGLKIEQSLYRYVVRMMGRATPFGLFAGCGIGTVGDRTLLEVGAGNTWQRRSRLDMEYLCNLAEHLNSQPDVRNQICFRPNSSLHFSAGRYRHAQSYFHNGSRLYRLVATEHTPYLETTLRRAASGTPPEKLMAALREDNPEITAEEADEYIGRLIESQLLVSDLVPPLIGPEALDHMLRQLTQAKATSISGPLQSISECLRDLDQSGIGADLDIYQRIVSIAGQLSASFKREHLVQVDVIKPVCECSLDCRLMQQILDAVEKLRSITPTREPQALSLFKQAFQERYQDEEIPLLEALDEEVGIGFDNKHGPAVSAEPLLENIDFIAREEKTEVKADQREFILAQRVEELLRSNETVLSLDTKLLRELHVANALPLPDSFCVAGVLCGPPDSASVTKQSFWLQGVYGPSGANLMARFCHADSKLRGYVENLLRAEENLEADNAVVFAEISHLPEGRAGNVLYRPALRQYEIPYLATPGLPAEQQIPLSDLLVSVRNDRIVLRSSRLNCMVRPRLTNAHNYQNPRNLPLYKFLCYLQLQNAAFSLAWDWGIVERSAGFLPRVIIGNVVVSPAQWNLSKEIAEKLAAERGAARMRNVHHWREDRRVPRFAFLIEADNRLLIDFDNALSMETFVEYAKRRGGATMMEMLPGPDGLCVRGPEGTFVNEVLIPFVKNQPPRRQANALDPPRLDRADSEIGKAKIQTERPSSQSSSVRKFLPGSEWLFAKVYGSPANLDYFLIDVVKPISETALAAGEIDSWFFIRYSDPHEHLRLRFHGDPTTLTSSVLPQLREYADRQLRKGTIWKLQLDTYEREIERYGGPAGISIAEDFFHVDSELVLEVVSILLRQSQPDLRWQLALRTVDRMLSGLDIDLASKHDLVLSLADTYERDYVVDQRYKKQVSEKFRQQRAVLESIVMSAAEVDLFPAEIHAALKKFSEQLKGIRVEIAEKRRTGEFSISIGDVAANYVHMHLNRLLRSVPNAQEAVLYRFLERIYASQMARQKRLT